MTQRLKNLYSDTIVPKLKEQFSYSNIHQVPKVTRITVNRGLGEASQNAKALGVMVTLRGDKMYAFLDRLISLSLPRIRDFRGISPKSFDGRGNYSLGVREQLIFPEIDYDSIDQIRGMDITIITTANTDEEGRALLKEMGMPFRSN